ncbi:hypothetical protein AKO1_014371, partial [Acrasis kona]
MILTCIERGFNVLALFGTLVYDRQYFLNDVLLRSIFTVGYTDFVPLFFLSSSMSDVTKDFMMRKFRNHLSSINEIDFHDFYCFITEQNLDLKFNWRDLFFCSIIESEYTEEKVEVLRIINKYLTDEDKEHISKKIEYSSVWDTKECNMKILKFTKEFGLNVPPTTVISCMSEEELSNYIEQHKRDSYDHKLALLSIYEEEGRYKDYKKLLSSLKRSCIKNKYELACSQGKIELIKAIDKVKRQKAYDPVFASNTDNIKDIWLYFQNEFDPLDFERIKECTVSTYVTFMKILVMYKDKLDERFEWEKFFIQMMADVIEHEEDEEEDMTLVNILSELIINITSDSLRAFCCQHLFAIAIHLTVEDETWHQVYNSWYAKELPCYERYPSDVKWPKFFWKALSMSKCMEVFKMWVRAVISGRFELFEPLNKEEKIDSSFMVARGMLDQVVCGLYNMRCHWKMDCIVNRNVGLTLATCCYFSCFSSPRDQCIDRLLFMKQFFVPDMRAKKSVGFDVFRILRHCENREQIMKLMHNEHYSLDSEFINYCSSLEEVRNYKIASSHFTPAFGPPDMLITDQEEILRMDKINLQRDVSYQYIRLPMHYEIAIHIHSMFKFMRSWRVFYNS